MNQKKLLKEQIESVSKQLKNEHHQYIVHKANLKTLFIDPRVLLVTGVFVLFIGFKIYKGQWRKAFNTLMSYGIFFISNRLKKQMLSYL